jgi:hypothetical protein
LSSAAKVPAWHGSIINRDQASPAGLRLENRPNPVEIFLGKQQGGISAPLPPAFIELSD